MNDKLVKKPVKVNHISFNQDQDCFACATDDGFRIYNTYPYDSTFQRNLGTPIGIVEMLFRSNIVAIVGADGSSTFPPNKVFIWDDHEARCVGEISFKHPVKGVRLRKDLIVAVLENIAYTYRFSDFQLLNKLPTFSNPEGLCALSSDANSLLVVPGEGIGDIQIINNEKDTRVTKRAHITGLAAIALSRDSRLCATASLKGTLVRIFSAADGTLLQELRRGASKALISSVAFDAGGNWLACASSRGTIHVFALSLAGKAIAPTESAEESKSDAKNPTSAFKFMQGIIPYFKSERSFAQFHVPEHDSVLTFGPEGSGVVVGTECEI